MLSRTLKMGQSNSTIRKTKARKKLTPRGTQAFAELPQALQDKIHSYNYRYEGLLPAEKALADVQAMEIFMIDADLNSPDPRQKARELYHLKESVSHPSTIKSLIEQAHKRIHTPLVHAWNRLPVKDRKSALQKHHIRYTERITQNRVPSKNEVSHQR